MTSQAPASALLPLRNKRIVVVLRSLELGGAERQALLLARHLVHEEQAQVEVWGFGQPGRAAALCEEYGLPWRLVPFHWGTDRQRRLLALGRLAWTLRAARPDLILPYTTLPNVVCGLIWRFTGARTCVWNQRDAGIDRLGPKAERWAARQTPCFVSNSQSGADFLVQTPGVPLSRVRVIHNGVILAKAEADRAAWRDRLGVGADTFVACMLANLHSFKDHATLLKAWRTVIDRRKSRGTPAVLVLAGRFDDRTDSLKALAYDLDLGHTAGFLGPVDDVAGLLGAVDLGVLSSRSEGCPNGVLESMAAGLAIVATDAPGVREAVGQDGLPFLAPPGDVEALADQIINLAADPSLRHDLGKANQRRIAAEFSPERMCRQMVKLISEAL